MIYLKTDEELTTIREVLLELYSHTSYGDGKKSVATYTDKECTTLQCYKDKYRSFDETLELVHTYLPNAEIKDIIHELIVLHLDKPLYLYFYYCNDINMSTCHYYTDRPSGVIPESHGHSKYSWKDIFELVGIDDMDEYKSYIEKYKLELK